MQNKRRNSSPVQRKVACKDCQFHQARPVTGNLRRVTGYMGDKSIVDAANVPTHGAVEKYETIEALRFDPALPPTTLAMLVRVQTDDPSLEGLPRLTPQPAKVKVQRIVDPRHPANGQSGLFARQTIMPEQFIITYLGFATLTPSQTSDYVLSYHQGLSIDAERMGNLARFINDFRGVADRPNAEFKTFYHCGTRAVLVGVYALRRKIRKGEEICVTYGKGYWQSRGVIEASVS